MPYRIYIRWPGQRVSDKTVTSSRKIADAAFEELSAQAQSLTARGAVGVTFTHDGKQVAYIKLNDPPAGDLAHSPE